MTQVWNFGKIVHPSMSFEKVFENVCEKSADSESKNESIASLIILDPLLFRPRCTARATLLFDI